VRKWKVFLIITLVVVALGVLIYKGFRFARGKPVPIPAERMLTVVDVAFLDETIDLSQGLNEDLWAEITPKEIGLVYQLMILPWPGGKVPSVSVKAFHNNEDIYFHLSWLDATENRSVALKKYTDACAVMLPFKGGNLSQNLMMGFMGETNIWQWKANQDHEIWVQKEDPEKTYVDFYYPFEDEETLSISKDSYNSAVNNLYSKGVGSLTTGDDQTITGRGIWIEGKWQVVFKRSLKAANPDVGDLFSTTERTCAFAVWEGTGKDRGGRKSISEWVKLVKK